MTATTANTTAELMTVLGCSKAGSIQPRLAELGKLDTCTRCGGSGEYSFNLTNGKTCFGCGGIGRVMPKKITPEFIAEVRTAVDAGGLVDYFARAKRKAEVAIVFGILKAEIDPIGKAYNAAYDICYRTGTCENGPAIPQRIYDLQTRANDLTYGKHKYKGTKDEEMGAGEIESAFRFTKNMPTERVNKLLDRLDEVRKQVAELVAEFNAE